MRFIALLLTVWSMGLLGCARAPVSGVELTPVPVFHRSDGDLRSMARWNRARVVRIRNASGRRIEWCEVIGRAGSASREFLLTCPLDPGENRHLVMFATLPVADTEWTVQQVGSDVADMNGRRPRNLVYLREDFLSEDGAIVWEMVERFSDDIEARREAMYLEFSLASLLSACRQSEERISAGEVADPRALAVVVALWSADGSAYQDALEQWLYAWVSAADLRSHTDLVLSLPYRTPMDRHRMQVKLGRPIDGAAGVRAPFDRLLPLLNRPGIDQQTTLVELAFDPTLSLGQIEEVWNLIGLAGGDGMRACLRALDKHDGLPSDEARWLLAGWASRDPAILAEIQPDGDLKAQLQTLAERSR